MPESFDDAFCVSVQRLEGFATACLDKVLAHQWRPEIRATSTTSVVPVVKRAQALSWKEQCSIVTLYTQGMSLHALAKRYRRKTTTVQRVLQAHHVPLRAPSLREARRRAGRRPRGT